MGASWGLLGALAGFSGPLEVPRVGSCRVLGDSGGPGPEVDAYLGSSWGAKREPKGTQNKSQNDPKAIIKSSSTSMALWKGLKTVLGRSWADLGSILGSREGQNHALA